MSEFEDLKKLIESTAAENRREFSELRQEIVATRRHVDVTAAETRRHFDVVAEDAKRRDELLAEGISNVNERVDRLRDEMKDEFVEVRATIRLSHSELERRLRTLEDTVSTLQTRVDRIENALNQ